MTSKTKKREGRYLLTVLLFVLLTTAAPLVGMITAVQGEGVEGVTRYAPASPAPGAEFAVQLTINGERPLIVGVVETIPEGFSFVSTTCEDYEVSGQKVVFAAIDETEITYTVQASSSGEGSFAGTWIDVLGENEGGIVETQTPPAGAATTTPVTTPEPRPTATSAATPVSEVPGFEVTFTAVSLLIACLFVVLRGTKGEEVR